MKKKQHLINLDMQCIAMNQSNCTSNEKHAYKGSLNGTIHVVAGGGGASLTNFGKVNTTWSLVKDVDYGFLKLTAFDHSNLLFEYKKSSNGQVHDSFSISRDYKDILACTVDSPLFSVSVISVFSVSVISVFSYFWFRNA